MATLTCWGYYQMLNIGVSLVGDVQMGFQDVAFLLLRASFSNTLLKNCVRGGSLMTTTYLKTVVEFRQGYALCRLLTLHQFLLCVCHISWRS